VDEPLVVAKDAVAVTVPLLVKVMPFAMVRSVVAVMVPLLVNAPFTLSAVASVNFPELV